MFFENHDYHPYLVDQTVYILLGGGSIVEGKVKTIAGMEPDYVYDVIMFDGEGIWPYHQSQVFNTKSNAQLAYYNGYQPSPTPTISLSNSSLPPQTYDQLILSKNPIAYWPLNTGINDIVSGNDLIPTPHGDPLPILESDNYGHYLFCDNPTNGYYLTNPITLSSNFSLEAWIEFEDLTLDINRFYTIFGCSRYEYQTNHYESLSGLQYDMTAGALLLYGNTIISSNFSMVPSKIYHIVVTVDANNNVIFYINGQAYIGDIKSSDTWNIQYIGNDSFGDFFYGMIGNPAIYGNTLTQDQVLENYVFGLTKYRYSSVSLPTPSPTISITPTPSLSL